MHNGSFTRMPGMLVVMKKKIADTIGGHPPSHIWKILRQLFRTLVAKTDNLSPPAHGRRMEACPSVVHTVYTINSFGEFADYSVKRVNSVTRVSMFPATKQIAV